MYFSYNSIFNIVFFHLVTYNRLEIFQCIWFKEGKRKEEKGLANLLSSRKGKGRGGEIYCCASISINGKDES